MLTRKGIETLASGMSNFLFRVLGNLQFQCEFFESRKVLVDLLDEAKQVEMFASL